MCCLLFRIALDTTYVAQSFVDVVEAVVAEALSSDSFVDVSVFCLFSCSFFYVYFFFL